MTRRLILVRHAKANWPEGIADHDRPLDPRGLSDASLVGHYVETHSLIPDLALVSTARRTQETWELIAGELTQLVPSKADHRIYEAKPDALLYIVHEVDPSIQCLMLIGHNPGIENLARSLIGSGNIEMRQRAAEKYPPGSLTVIDFSATDWADVEAHSGRLEQFITPHDMIRSDD